MGRVRAWCGAVVLVSTTASVALYSAACISIAEPTPEPPDTVRSVGSEARATLPPSLPSPPPHRGELELATSTRLHTYGDALRPAFAPSAYATAGSAEGVIGYRASRFFGVRALGSLGFGPGGTDAYSAPTTTATPSWPTRLGVGFVTGFASDTQPVQLQLAVDGGLIGIAGSRWGHSERRSCTQLDLRGEMWACSPWTAETGDGLHLSITVRPYFRAVAIVGFDITSAIRMVLQAGLVFGPFPDEGSDVDYNLVVAFDANVEWLLDPNTSLFASGGWAALDPFFTHGPSFSLGIRVVLPSTGPGSVRREQEARVRQIARRWNLVAPPPLVLTPHLAPHSMLRSRVPVPDWMLDILGASIEMTVGPADAEQPEADAPATE